MAHGVEEFLQFEVCTLAVVRREIFLQLAERIVCTAMRAEAKAARTGHRVIDARQHLADGLLDNRVHYGRYASGRVLPLPLGISTRRTEFGR